MEELVFERQAPVVEVSKPLCAITCFRLKNKGVKPLEGEARIGFDPFKRRLAGSVRQCRIEKRKSDNPGEAFVATLYIPLFEEEAAELGASWISLFLKPDAKASEWFLALDASLQRSGGRSGCECLEVEFRLADDASAFGYGTSDQQRVGQFVKYINDLPIAPTIDPQSRDELMGVWDTYIKALGEIVRKKTLFFKVDRVDEARLDEKSGNRVHDVYYDQLSFINDNIKACQTILRLEDFQDGNFSELRRKIWDAVRGEDFDIYDEQQKNGLVDQLGKQFLPKKETTGRAFARLASFDLSEHRLSFRIEEETDDDEDKYSARVALPQPGEYLVPRRSGELTQIGRMDFAFNQLKQGKLHNSFLGACLFDAQNARPAQIPAPNTDAAAMVRSRLLNKSINEEQFSAVMKALRAPDLALIQGPPGTGKTTVIAEIIHQTLAENPSARILLTSQSHLAVDNALERLRNDNNMRPIRIAGSDEARRSLEVEGRLYLEDRIDEWTKTAEGGGAWSPEDNAVARDYDRRLRALIASSGGDVNIARYVEKARKSLMRIDREFLWKTYMKSVNVVAATCSECGRRDFRERWKPEGGFDVVIVDEVSKAAPPELFVPLVHAKKVVLIGDHRQLPPMIEEKLLEERLREIGVEDLEEKLNAMKISLFERLFQKANSSIRETLRVQYRMHESIQKVIEQFYADDGGLKLGLSPYSMESSDMTDPASRHHGLEFGTFISPRDHALWVDVPGIEKKDGTSYYNEEEIDAVAETIRALRAGPGWEAFAGNPRISPEIGVISFYGSQTGRIKKRLEEEFAGINAKFRIRPVDKFQGMERDIVIVSLVRSSRFVGEDGRSRRNDGIGFAQDYRRINVAFSRARRLLVIVGNHDHFCKSREETASRYYQRIWENLDVRGGCRTAAMLRSALEREGAV